MQTRQDDGRPDPTGGRRRGFWERRQRRLTAAILVAVMVAAAAVAVSRLFPRTPELGACREAVPVPVPPAPPARPVGVPGGAQAAVVVLVVDGDGICVQPAGPGPLPEGRIAEVRLIGVNAPGKGVCGSERAAGLVRERIGDGTMVWLEADEQDRDRYGRHLRYVWEPEKPEKAGGPGRSDRSGGSGGELFNVAAVREGYARALPKPPNERYKDEISEAEADARHDGGGVWRCLPWRFLRWLPVRR